jgi:hypothetical protein
VGFKEFSPNAFGDICCEGNFDTLVILVERAI